MSYRTEEKMADLSHTAFEPSTNEAYTNTDTHTRVRTHIHTHPHIRKAHAHTHTNTYTHTHSTRTHTYTHTHIHTHTRTRIHTHPSIPSWLKARMQRIAFHVKNSITFWSHLVLQICLKKEKSHYFAKTFLALFEEIGRKRLL